MTGEIDIGGVFLPSLLIWAVIAFVPTFAVRRLLLAVGFYRFVWHRALFDIALFVAMWGGLAALSSTFFAMAHS